MIPLAVCNHKGGTGKTTTTLMVAAALGLSGHRVLVIDLDPQGFLSRMMGVSDPDPACSSRIVFDMEGRLDPTALQRFDAFELLPASGRLSADLRRLHKPTDVLWLREFTDRELGDYDYVFFDTAAALTVFTLNALVAAKHILIPVLPEYQPVIGGEQTFQTALMVQQKLNPDMQRPLFLLTMVDARKRNHHWFRHHLRERYESQVFDQIVRTSTSLSVVRSDGRTAFEADPHSRGSLDYANVADELLRRLSVTVPDLEPVAS